jgi:hypothetical protein
VILEVAMLVFTIIAAVVVNGASCKKKHHTNVETLFVL